MEISKLLALEWESFVEKRRKIGAIVLAQRKRLNAFTEEPAIKNLLDEKKRLSRFILTTQQQISTSAKAVAIGKDILEHRRLALEDEDIRKELASRLSRCKRNLRKAQRRNASADMIESDQNMIWLLETSFVLVEAWVQMACENQQRHQAVLDTSRERIAMLDDQYRQAKHCLEDEIQEQEQRQRNCYKEEIEWATQSRIHLEWMLKQQPFCRDDLLRRYRERFPDDDLSEFFPRIALPPVQQGTNSKKRRPQQPCSAAVVPETVPSVPQPWKFEIMFLSDQEGEPLPEEKDSFLSALQPFLDKESYRDLDVKIVYDKLIAITRMTVQQRHGIKKILGHVDASGWKIVRAGMQYRLFLSIDEAKRLIRFIPRRRKESYKNYS